MTNTLQEKADKALVVSARLMKEHGIGDWKIEFNRKRTALAETYFNRKTIMFSRYFLVIADKDDFIGVTLHEIAHVLVGPRHNHDKTFVDKCIEISPDDKFARRAVEIPMPKWIYKCPKGHGEFGTLRKRKRTPVCKKCFDNDEHVELERRENILTVKSW